MKTVIYAKYDDDDLLKKGAKSLMDKGVKIKEVYSPFPIHGLEDILGIKRTRLAIVSFLFGITGAFLAIWGIWYFMISDWPLNIGGKPNKTLLENIPSFVPVIFEFTVFCAAHGMALTYLLRNKNLPGTKPRNPDPRSTNDLFIMEIQSDDNDTFGREELQSTIRETPVLEVDEKQF